MSVGCFHTWQIAGRWVINEVMGALWEEVVETGEEEDSGIGPL